MWSLRRSLLGHSRYRSFSGTPPNLPPYYFLDTNILIYAQPQTKASYPTLSSWLHRAQGTLFITEQVRTEYLRGAIQVPPFVEYRPSGIPDQIKALCVEELISLFPQDQRRKVCVELFFI